MNNDLTPVFTALGDQTRLAIIQDLARGPRPVSALSAPASLTQQGLSKHLQVLIEAGLVIQEKRGRQRICSLNRERVEDAMDWLGDQIQVGSRAEPVVVAFDPSMD